MDRIELSQYFSVYRPQRKSFYTLVISAIVLAFLLGLLSASIYEVAKTYLGKDLPFLAIALIIIVFFVIPFTSIEQPPMFVKILYIPLVFLMKKEHIKFIDAEDYNVSLTGHLAVEEIFQYRPAYEKRFLESLKHIDEMRKRADVTEEKEWAYLFLKHLTQYLFWERIETFYSDFFNKMRELKKVKTLKVLFADYPDELSANMFVQFFTSSEKKPQEDVSNIAETGTKYGTWKNPDFLYLEFPENVTLEVGNLESFKPFLKFKSKFGELRIEFGIFSLTVEGQKIRFFTDEKLDFEDFLKTPEFEAVCRMVIRFSRFSTLRGGFEDYIEWTDALMDSLIEMDWGYFLRKVPIEKISKIENRITNIEEVIREDCLNERPAF